MERFAIIETNKIEELPKTTGVYCFLDKKETIYIGKAINIKNRVKNHFQQPSYRDNLFMDKVDKIGFFETDSEIEALVLEANLIKKYQPKFNVVWRDDKNYFYVAISQNPSTGSVQAKIPYVFITHQQNFPKTKYIGPFVEGNALKKTLKFLRRAFPFYTTTLRQGSGRVIHPKNKCTWCHLGLCPGPVRNSSHSVISNGAGPFLNLPAYKKDIKKLILILKGKRNAVLKSLEKEMKILSKENKFEKAAKVRDRIYNLQQVMSHRGIIEPEKKSFQENKIDQESWQKTQKILQGLTNLNKEISRIECYDISNIQGNQAVGSMVVFVNGKPDKNQYRKFKILLSAKPNDIAMLKETLERRFKHKEWKYPEIILIDGGIAQLNIAITVKNNLKETLRHSSGQAKNIRVISIAKRNPDLYIENKRKPILLKTLPQEIYNLVLQLDDEAHRFAITYHKKLRKKNLLK